jgi:hypothetical protein
MPHIPFLSQKANSSPFYGPDDEIPILVTVLMGLQRNYDINAFFFLKKKSN